MKCRETRLLGCRWVIPSCHPGQVPSDSEPRTPRATRFLAVQHPSHRLEVTWSRTCSNGLPGSSESRDFFSDWYSNDAEPAPQPGWGLLRLCERDMLCVPVKCECRGELHFDRVDDAVLDRNAPYEHSCWKSMVIFLNLTLEPRLSLRRSSQPMRLGATTRGDCAGPMASAARNAAAEGFGRTRSNARSAARAATRPA